MNGYLVVVTIGRNVGKMPMTLQDWFGFRKQVLNDLSDVQALILQKPVLHTAFASQVGCWNGEEEESAAYVAAVSTLGRLARLQDSLRNTGAVYKQEAIGFITVQGTRHFA